jgi:hypothetical protein
VNWIVVGGIVAALGLLLFAWAWARIGAIADGDLARFYRDRR